MRILLTGALYLLGWVALTCQFPLYGQMPTELKNFLEERSFPELIENYREDHIVLTTKGKEAKRVAALPYSIEAGYRCQVFAGSQQKNAQKAAAAVRSLGLDSVYVFQTAEGLYKVQVGNFGQRREAEIMLDRLKNAGIEGAWIVREDVHISKPAEEIAAMQAEQATALTPGVYYAIQIFATNDPQKAARIQENAAGRTTEPVEVVRQATIWKVLVGKYSERAAAEAGLKVLRKGAYADAWITQASF